MNLFEVVKASINTREAAQTYGIDVNHHGMALCPFHNDRHPSLYVSDDHYHCFACGEHGDVIDLTAAADSDVSDRAIDRQVSRLRRKLAQGDATPDLLRTIWGGGYLLAAEVSECAP